jgi:homoserine O-acetyltransferase/O-succinyltransferase
MSSARWEPADAAAAKTANTIQPPKNARHYAALPDPFPMQCGKMLHGAQIAYETWGEPNLAVDNVILLYTGLSPSAHAASSVEDSAPGWWEKIVGPGLAIDTTRWFVICVNALGSCFGSTGPATVNPETSELYRLEFPELALEDIARAGYETLRFLGITQLAAVIGPSLGGSVSLAFVALFPGVARQLLVISGTAAASPVAIALRSVQRESILLDPQWQHGNYPIDQPPITGIRLARKLGTITYRSSVEWEERFGRTRIPNQPSTTNDFAPEFEIEGYLEAQAEKFARAFDANCNLYLSRALDRFDLSDHGANTEIFARSGLERALVIGVESDMLFQIAEQESLAAELSSGGIDTTFARLDCREGHDSFLVNTDAFETVISSFLNA